MFWKPYGLALTWKTNWRKIGVPRIHISIFGVRAVFQIFEFRVKKMHVMFSLSFFLQTNGNM